MPGRRRRRAPHDGPHRPHLGGDNGNDRRTHSYVDTAPTRTITVKQVWTAGWSTGSDQGTLTDLSTVASLQLPVTQLQAVRNS